MENVISKIQSKKNVVLIIVGSIFCILMTLNILETENPVTENLFDTKNSSFYIYDTIVTLKDGVTDQDLKTVTRYFGNEVSGDVNGDGLEDILFLVTQETSGTGIFYYAVVALKNTDGYKTTNAFFIGDRISPQSNEIHPDSMEIHINYAERRDDDPMTTKPSVGAVKLLKVTKGGILEGLMK